MTGPFKWDLVNAAKGNGFSNSISRTLKTHEITTAHKLWKKMDTHDKAAFLANCGTGVGATWTETTPERENTDPRQSPRLPSEAAEENGCHG